MISEKFLEHEIANLNVHLTQKKISLKEAMLSEKPHVQTKGGGKHFFKRDELDFLKEIVSDEDLDKLLLPITIMMQLKLGRGSARISGIIEANVIGKILGKPFSEGDILYRPEVVTIRAKLPTTTEYLFLP